MSKIRLALLGCGGIMNKHAGQSKDIDDVEIVGLCDVADENMDRLIERSLEHMPTKPPKFKTAVEMYDATKPDAVVIATPHTLHYDNACEALEHGCHMLMEKPMVTELAQAVDLAQRVEDAGKIFCIAYNTPCSAEMYTLREIIRRKDLGNLKVVSMHLSQNWYRGTKGKWRQDPALSGGGQMYDSGAHMLCSLCWTVESDVTEVAAFIDRLDTAVDINGVVNVKFANGVMASYAVTAEGPNSSYGTWIFDEGRVELDPWNAGRIHIFRGCRGAGEEVKYPQMEGADRQPLSNFIDAIQGRDEPRTSPRVGVIQSQLMDAVYEAERTNGVAKPRAV